jgi:tRNA-2-methylthio-N6-dimethylallyladenosine synthase
MSSHPNYMTSELITYLAQSSGNGWWTLVREKIGFVGHQRPYLHFAIQSGSDNILKRMNRSYTKSEFLHAAKLMQEMFDKISLSTDIIVGFPGETEADYQETTDVMKEIGFGMAFISEYSPRSGTAADKLGDDIPHEIKEQRKTYLNDEILMPASLKENKELIDQEQAVLVTGYSERFKALQAKTVDYKVVLIENSDDKSLIGKFVKVKFSNATPWALKSKLVL